jgi:glycosyltransferase involved in cell wall biosynthesis
VVLIHPAAGVNWSGGAEIFAIELAQQLRKYFEVELLSGASCGDFSRPVGGIPRARSHTALNHPALKALWSPFTSFPEIWLEHASSFFPCLLELLRRPADLILPCNDKGGLAVAATVRALTGTPMLYTEHLGMIEGGSQLVKNLKFKPDHLVVFAEEVAQFAHTLRPQQPISVIPNGIDLSQFTPDGDRIDLGLPKPVVVCVSSLYRSGYKRADLAIQAMAQLQQGSLLLCGQGVDQEYFQLLGEELLGRDRFAIRTFPHAQMPAVYRSADLFTLASVDEPFGFAYVEAMASGLPVVTTDDAMRRHIIGEAGIVCDVTNSKLYANSIYTALNLEWGTKPRQTALRFGWDTVIQKYRDAIQFTIEQSHRDASD